ncbi:MAG: AAA family ATPase [Chloroflexi bacterium]|nr:AAA family ATPase [Chloroflexota bacterium]
MQNRITDNLDLLLDSLPVSVARPLRDQPDSHNLLEVVLDLGRPPEARFPDHEVVLREQEVTDEDIQYAVSRIGTFGDDNRAGIARTLHRISAIRNRQGRIVGLTCRVGRAVYGTIQIIQDLIGLGQSILLLGRPGIGKTTMLREVARVLADDLKKRVVIVDTSNEIAGDGDIPHPAIGHARRMQVATPARQHAVMIEAVENHMPEVIVIDEIGTELEAAAARTIAERGVQLVATAHGNTLENLIMNPTLADLVGGVQTVTLGDEEARRRGTQKSILERKAPPTFDIVIEIQDRNKVAVHPNVGVVVDSILRGRPVAPEVRWQDETGQIKQSRGTLGIPGKAPARPAAAPAYGREYERIEAPAAPAAPAATRVYPFGVNRHWLDEAIQEASAPVSVVENVGNATVLVTTKNFYRRKPQIVRDAEDMGLPIYVLRSNTLSQMRQFLRSMTAIGDNGESMEEALRDVEDGIGQIMSGEKGVVELRPQPPQLRRMQHQRADSYGLASQSLGREPQRRVRLFKG